MGRTIEYRAVDNTELSYETGQEMRPSDFTSIASVSQENVQSEEQWW